MIHVELFLPDEFETLVVRGTFSHLVELHRIDAFAEMFNKHVAKVLKEVSPVAENDTLISSFRDFDREKMRLCHISDIYNSHHHFRYCWP